MNRLFGIYSTAGGGSAALIIILYLLFMTHPNVPLIPNLPGTPPSKNTNPSSPPVTPSGPNPGSSGPFYFDLSQQNQTSAPINYTTFTHPIVTSTSFTAPPSEQSNSKPQSGQHDTILAGGGGGGGSSGSSSGSSGSSSGSSGSSSGSSGSSAGGITITQNSLAANPPIIETRGSTAFTEHFMTTPTTSGSLSQLSVVQPNGDICRAKGLPFQLNSAGELSKVYPTDFFLFSGGTNDTCNTNQSGTYSATGQVVYNGKGAVSDGSFLVNKPSSPPNITPPPGSSILIKTSNVTSGSSPLPVLYTYNETNTGNVSIFNVTVIDDKCSPVAPGSVSVILPGKSALFTCDQVFQVHSGLPAQSFTNHATAHGVLANGTSIPAENANATVLVSPENITSLPLSMIKTPNVLSGVAPLKVTYNYILSNPTAQRFTNVSISDNHCVPVTFVSDSDSDGVPSMANSFEPGESLKYKCGPVKLTSTTTNTANATAGCIPLCVDVVGKASASATVQVISVSPPPFTPIPVPSLCTYVGHPISPLSQTTVAIGNSTFTKHAEKELYYCTISGFPDSHFILDLTTYTSIRENNTGAIFSITEVLCAKNPFSGTPYTCELEKVGQTLASTKACRQLDLGFPMAMDTVVVNGVAKTIESQKEIFKCNPLVQATITSGSPSMNNTSSSTSNTVNSTTYTVIQDIIIWTTTPDNSTEATAPNHAYAIEVCQKPVTITTGLPLLNCVVAGPKALTP